MKTNQLSGKYKQFSDASGLPTKMERASSSGYHRVKTPKELAKSEKSGIINKSVDFYVGNNGKTLKAEYASWIGQNKMSDYMKLAESDSVKSYIRADYRKSSFIGDGGTADVRRFEIETGLNLGRNQNTHEQKVYDLTRQINKLLKTELSDNDRRFLEKQLSGLKGVTPNEV